MQELLISNLQSANYNTSLSMSIKATQIHQKKITTHNPIFNKLNKIFQQPKTLSSQISNIFALVPLVSSVKITHIDSKQSHNVCFRPKVYDCYRPKEYDNKDNCVTAETQPSCVFLQTNPSSIFSKTNTHKFHLSTLENKENDPFWTNQVSKESQINRQNQLGEVSNRKRISSKNENMNLSSNPYRPESNQKYFYENHKLKRLGKPHITTAACKFSQLNESKQLQQSIQNYEYKDRYLSKRIQLIPQTNPQSQKPSLKCLCHSNQQAVNKIQYLQQKVQYYEKMQEFYLNQIETYRQDKQTLQWKLKLIVEELLYLTMKDKLISSGMKASQSGSFIKQNKELIMSKINRLNFSQHIADIVTENKQNYSIDINTQMRNHNLHLQNLDKLHIPLYPSSPKQAQQKLDLETNSQYVSSFLLDNVTLVESESEDNEHDEIRSRALRQKVLDIPLNQIIGKPQHLTFT